MEAESDYKESLSYWRTCHIDFSGNCVILHFSCGGTAGQLNICYWVRPLIVRDPSSKTPCDQLIVWGPF